MAEFERPPRVATTVKVNSKGFVPSKRRHHTGEDLIGKVRRGFQPEVRYQRAVVTLEDGRLLKGTAATAYMDRDRIEQW